MRELIDNYTNLTYWKIVVDDLTSFYDEQIRDINPNVKEWPLMSSPFPTIYLSLTYLILVIFLGIVMRYTKQLNIKFLILLYNLLSICLNIYISFKIITIKYQAKDFYICTQIKSQNSEYSLEMNKIIWWFYISKGIEFLDTIFFVLRKKFHRISFLHIYNHATMFPIWWFGTSYLANGTLAIAALMNSILHILLFYYYIISTIGPSFQKYVWWKKYFVQLQMLQFSILIVGCAILLYKDCGERNDRLIWCLIYYSLSHIALIYDFYSNSYYKIMVKNLDKKTEEESLMSQKEAIKFSLNSSKSSPSKNGLFKSLLGSSNGSLHSTPSDFRVQATRRRPLHYS